MKDSKKMEAQVIKIHSLLFQELSAINKENMAGNRRTWEAFSISNQACVEIIRQEDKNDHIKYLPYVS